MQPVDGGGGSGSRLGARRDLAVLLALTAIGFWMRVKGITFGLPFNYHFDENLYADTARNFHWRSVHPAFGPFQALLIGEARLLHFLMPLLDRLRLSPEVAAALASPMMSYHLLARWTSAVCGAATVIPLYCLGRAVWNRTVGVLGAVFLDFAYLHVRGSHFGVTDTTVTLLVVLGALACSAMARTRAWKHYVLAGLAAGLAVPIKQVTWPILILIYLWHAFGGEPAREPAAPAAAPAAQPPAAPWWRRLIASVRSAKLAAAYATAAVALVCTSPQVVLAWSKYLAYWKMLAALGAKGGLDRLALDPGPRWFFYLTSLRWGLGELLCWLSLAGCAAILVRRRPRGALLLMTYPVLVLLFLCLPGNFYFARYAMTAVPFMILAGAALLAGGLDRLRAGRGARAAAAAAAALVVTAQPLICDLRFDQLLGREDTRTAAKKWIEANVPAGSRITIEAWVFGPQLASAGHAVPFSLRLYEVKTKGAYGLSEAPKPAAGQAQRTMSVEDYERAGTQYIVSNSFSSDSHLLVPAEDRDKQAFYAELRRRARLVLELSPFAAPPREPMIFDETYAPALHLFERIRPGPTIRIYRLSDHPPATAAEGAT